MEQQLVACARQLFEGVPGSVAQQQANAWLMALQRSDDAWEPALHVLRQPPVEHGHVIAAPVLVAMQIVRLKTSHEWIHMTAHQKHYVRDTLLSLLAAACTSDSTALPLPALRVACVVIADMAVKSCCSDDAWHTWRSDLQQIVDASLAHKSALGAILFEEVVGAIPHQIAASLSLWPTSNALDAVVATFALEYDHVLHAASTILTSIPDAQMQALQCIENWLVGCVAPRAAFGLSIVQLYRSRVLELLFDVATTLSDCCDQAQLAAEILADAIASASSSDPFSDADEALKATIAFAVERLMPTTSLLLVAHNQQQSLCSNRTETQQTIGRGLARIACALAINHTAIVFAPVASAPADSAAPHPMLSYLLACAAHADIAVMAPTLEFWFFFLDKSTQRGSLFQMLSATDAPSVVTLLHALVTALIRHCRFPVAYVYAQLRDDRIDDDDEDDEAVDAIKSIRREIADTLQSLFAKWPDNNGGANRSVACVANVVELLFASVEDVATVDALLFVLDAMIELFDVDSSDANSDISDDDDDEAVRTADAACDSGVAVLQSVLLNAHVLPAHPLIVCGVARYTKSLSAAFVLPSAVYIAAALALARGLAFATSFRVAALALRTQSASISKYTNVSDRSELLDVLVAASVAAASVPRISTAAHGDLIQATFHTMDGVSDAVFRDLCSRVLSPLTAALQHCTSSLLHDCARALALLGRAICGVQAPPQARALVDQLWPLVRVTIATQRVAADAACRASALQLFLYLVPVLDAAQRVPSAIERDVLDVAVRWYSPDALAPDALRVVASIVNHDKHDRTAFATTLDDVLPTLVHVFRCKLRDAPVDDLDAGERSVTLLFCTDQRHVDAIADEVVAFFALMQQTLLQYPHVLSRRRRNDAVDPHSLLWHVLRLSSILLDADHEHQAIVDAVCDFVVAASCAASPSPRHDDDAIVLDVEQFAPSLVQGALRYIGSPLKRATCRTRNVIEFLYQVLHAPRVPSYVQQCFHAALRASLFASTALRRVLSVDALEEVQTEMLARRQRHRFRQYATQLVRHLDDVEDALAKTAQ